MRIAGDKEIKKVEKRLQQMKESLCGALLIFPIK